MQLDNMFLQACKNNQKSVAQTFLKRGGVDVNKRDESGNTPLIYACLKGARDLVKILLDNGADAGLGNQKNRTPLHFAAQSGNFQVMAMLLDAGADVNSTDNDGVTALMTLALNGKTDAALKLMEHVEIDTGIQDNKGRKAIDYAASAGLRELVKALSQPEGAHTDAYGNTTLHRACWDEQSEVVKVLLEKDPAGVNKLNEAGLRGCGRHPAVTYRGGQRGSVCGQGAAEGRGRHRCEGVRRADAPHRGGQKRKE